MNPTDLFRLTPENLLALAAIEGYTARCGSGPSLRQLARLLGLSAHTAARQHVLRLAEMHLLTFQRTPQGGRIASHTMRVTDAGRRLLQLYPVAGPFPARPATTT